MAVKFEHLPKLFKLLGKFDRCAVLSDEAWPRTGADIEGALIPGLEMKGFAMDELEAAEEWLAATVSNTYMRRAECPQRHQSAPI